MGARDEERSSEHGGGKSLFHGYLLADKTLNRGTLELFVRLKCLLSARAWRFPRINSATKVVSWIAMTIRGHRQCISLAIATATLAINMSGHDLVSVAVVALSKCDYALSACDWSECLRYDPCE
jgi:hypothetical protein